MTLVNVADEKAQDERLAAVLLVENGRTEKAYDGCY